MHLEDRSIAVSGTTTRASASGEYDVCNLGKHYLTLLATLAPVCCISKAVDGSPDTPCNRVMLLASVALCIETEQNTRSCLHR